MSNNNKTSLWKLLDKHEIVVPIIQRDYAQGRKGKEDLRFRFLSNLMTALSGGKEAKLDFVYGGVNNNQMSPLDGQQRLTTLWLLHWFIAFHAGKLKEEEVCTRLKKFYYATRPSSTEFCRRLVDEFSKIDKDKVEAPITKFIKNQHWYYSYYNNDPTIQAMLLMIEGDRGKDEKGNEKVKNGLEQFFENDCNFSSYWEKLIGKGCPIQFYHQDMVGDDVPLVDDLYIKMNARGKQLTNFENFKAELIGYDKDDFRLDVENENDKQFVSDLDNAWMNIFWPYKKDSYNRVDEIYYRFVNQMLLNYYLIKNNNKVKIGDEEKEIEIDKTPLYSLLMDGSKFNKIEDYDAVLDSSLKEIIFNTLNGIEKCAKSNKNINEYLSKNLSPYISFDFIPQYEDKDFYEDQDNLPTTTLKQIPQVIFFATCKFFEKWNQKGGEWNEDTCSKLQDWIRFCYNISYNPLVNTVESMQGSLKVINEISDKLNCIDIYGKLSEFDTFKKINLDSNVAHNQIEEEYYKAKYQKNNNELKKKFIEAEQYSFFKGCIRFLLWNESGKYSDPSLFEDKYNKAKQLFSPKDSLEGRLSNKNCFRQYFCACTKLEDIISNDNNGDNCIRFNNSGEAWKTMLSNKSLCHVTHKFLIQDTPSKEALKETLYNSINSSDVENKENERKRIEYVIDTVLEDQFMEHLESLGAIVSGVLFLRKNYEWALYPKNAKSDRKVIVLGTSRNKVLKELLDTESIQTDNHVDQSSIMFYGWNIPFTYNKFHFEWKWNNLIEYNNGNQADSRAIAYNIESKDLKQVLNKFISDDNIQDGLSMEFV